MLSLFNYCKTLVLEINGLCDCYVCKYLTLKSYKRKPQPLFEYLLCQEQANIVVVSASVCATKVTVYLNSQ